MKKTILSLLILIFVLSGIPAEGYWTSADGEYFNRVVWRGDAAWEDDRGNSHQGKAYVGAYGPTYGLPSPSVALRLYPNREDHLTGPELRGNSDERYVELPLYMTADGMTVRVHNFISDDKIYLTGREAIRFTEALAAGHDVSLTVDVRGSIFHIFIPHDGFREFFDEWLSREEFSSIGSWNVEESEDGYGTYASVTRWTNEDPDAALYFEIYGNPGNPASLQTVKASLYRKHGRLAYQESRIDKCIVTHDPEEEWRIEENIFGSCYLDPFVKQDFLETMKSTGTVTLKVTDKTDGKVYTADFSPEEMVLYLTYPYEFDY